MSRQSLRKLHANLAVLMALTGGLFYLSSPRAVWGSVFFWQSPPKSISHTPEKNQPLRLEKVKVAGKLALPKAGGSVQENIDAGDDWMRGLSLTLKNTSGKNIVYALIYLHFPEAELAGGAMSFPLAFGRSPKDSNDRDYKAVLKPGEETEITLTDAQHDSLQSFLRGRSAGSIGNVEVLLVSVITDDDTLWMQGIEMRRDPNDPKHWLTIKQ